MILLFHLLLKLVALLQNKKLQLGLIFIEKETKDIRHHTGLVFEANRTKTELRSKHCSFDIVTGTKMIAMGYTEM